MKELIILFIVMLGLVSCGCVQLASGLVLDKETGKPLADVIVYKKNKKFDQTTTDSTGLFKLESISGGCRGCPPMTVKIEKLGYKDSEISIPSNEHLILKIEKSKLQKY